jgi:long-chain acyl-CoA synthetase
VALVVANVPAVKAWGDQHHLAPALPAAEDALLKDDRVRSLMRGEIEANSGEFKGFEGVKDFALIADDFTTDNGMLTPSMKLKRRKVMETYGSIIEQLYAKKGDERSASTSARA